MINKKLSEKIRSRRKELKMSQEELASLVGYTDRSIISRIEKGLVDLTESKIMAIAKALEITPEILVGWEDTMSIVEKKDLINKINDARNNKNLSVNQVINEVGIPKWLDETSSEIDILKVARFLNVSTQKNQYILSFEAERNDLKNFYDWFIENTQTLNAEEIKKLKLTIDNILKLINKGD